MTFDLTTYDSEDNDVDDGHEERRRHDGGEVDERQIAQVHDLHEEAALLHWLTCVPAGRRQQSNDSSREPAAGDDDQCSATGHLHRVRQRTNDCTQPIDGDGDQRQDGASTEQHEDRVHEQTESELAW